MPSLASELTLGQLQELFVELEARWVLWVLNHPGWKLRKGEGRILQLGPDAKGRLGYDVETNRPRRFKDRVHMDGSLHYLGLASDWNLFVQGEFITSGKHAAWVEAGEHWEGMNSLARWGGRFNDSNHLSLAFGGKS